MSLTFLAAFGAGLALAVYAMIRGVERTPRTSGPAVDALGRQLAPARTALSAPVVSAFLTVSGAVGYTLIRSTTLPLWVSLLCAIGSGAAAGFSAGALITRWVIPAASEDETDERYLLQGHLARWTVATHDSAGEIVYVIEGVRHKAPAQSVDGSPIASNTDVVIERFEDGVAFVEPWVRVEQRL